MPTTATVDAHTDPARDTRRAERYAAQRWLWRNSSIRRCVDCGRAAVNEGGSIGIKVSGVAAAGTRQAGFSGLATCGSVWACPVCAEKISARRADDLANVVRVWQATGGHVGMVTLTMRHRDGQRLEDLWDACSYAWSKVTSGRGWVDLQDRHGVDWLTATPVERDREPAEFVQLLLDDAPLDEPARPRRSSSKRIPWVRAVEVTHGKNGWHVHVHVLVLLAPGSDCAGAGRGAISPIDAIGSSMFARWRDALERLGLDAPIAGKGGLDARLLGGDATPLGEYLTKATYRGRTADRATMAGFEVAAGSMKSGRGENRSPFQILRDLVDPDPSRSERDRDRDARLWATYERVSRGRRQLTWSRGLREFCDVDLRTDEELAAETLDGDLVLLIDSHTWCGKGTGLALYLVKGEILRAAESDDTGAALRAYLADLAVPLL